jgi:hypothetical protein
MMPCLTMRSLLAALFLASVSSAFVPQQNRAFRSTSLLKKLSDDYKSDFPSPEDEKYEGEIDWDSEWKKVVANKDQPLERPGKDFYKSEAEIAAIKAAKKAQEKVADVASNIPSVPSFDTLKGDWKFWIGVLAIISVGFSVISASGTATSYNGNSYYI